MNPKLYFDVAMAHRQSSTCARLKVGAVIINQKTGRVLSAGYNGNPSGLPNCNSLFKKFIDNNGEDIFLIHFDVLPKYLGYQLDNIKTFLNEKRISYYYDTNYYKVNKDDWGQFHHSFSEKYEIHAEQNAIFSLFQNNSGFNPEDLILITTTAPCFNCCKLISSSGIKTVLYEEPYNRIAFEETEKVLFSFGIKLYQKDEWFKINKHSIKKVEVYELIKDEDNQSSLDIEFDKELNFGIMWHYNYIKKTIEKRIPVSKNYIDGFFANIKNQKPPFTVYFGPSNEDTKSYSTFKIKNTQMQKEVLKKFEEVLK